MVLKHNLVVSSDSSNRKATAYLCINAMNSSVLPNTLAFGPNTQALDSFCLPLLLCFLFSTPW